MKLSVITDSWISLAIAIFFGVLGTISMKLSNGLKIRTHTINLIVFYSISFVALTFAMKHIELSIVYAVWSGIGTVIVAGVGIAYFNESLSKRKVIFLLLIVLGVIGLNLSDGLS